jgi:hypothetical protein
MPISGAYNEFLNSNRAITNFDCSRNLVCDIRLRICKALEKRANVVVLA